MGKSIVTPNHVYTKLGNGTIRDLTLDTNTDTVYTHPTYKVCNYSVDTSQFATKQVATETQDGLMSASMCRKLNTSSLKVVQFTGTSRISSSQYVGPGTATIYYADRGFSSVYAVIVIGYGQPSDGVSDGSPTGIQVTSFTNTSASIKIGGLTNAYNLYYSITVIGV